MPRPLARGAATPRGDGVCRPGSRKATPWEDRWPAPGVAMARCAEWFGLLLSRASKDWGSCEAGAQRALIG